MCERKLQCFEQITMDFYQKKIDFGSKLATPLVASFISMFYAYHHVMNCPHANIFITIFSTNFQVCPKMCHKSFENWFTYRYFVPKNNF